MDIHPKPQIDVPNHKYFNLTEMFDNDSESI